MAEDVVEIIEIYPEIIVISDEEDEENKDVIVINYDSTSSDGGNNENVITIKEENVEEPAATNVEAHNDSLPSPEEQPNTNRTNKKNPALGKLRSKKRKKTHSGKANTTNSVNAVQMTCSPNRIQKKVGKSDSMVIKQEEESTSDNSIDETETNLSCTSSNTANNNCLQNDCLSNNSNTDESTASSSTAVLQPENPQCHAENYDYSKLSWLKPLHNLSSPPHLQLVIIDRSHPDWKIETNKWLMIEKRLLETLHTEMLRSNDSSIGLFDGAKWQRGIKVVGCHNKKALNFIKNFILKLDKLWAGANLDVCTMAYFERQICKVFIPPPVLKTDIVLSLIKLQNPSICCDDWEVLGERERNRGIDLWLSVNGESYSHLRRLRGEIKYGINRIFVNPVL